MRTRPLEQLHSSVLATGNCGLCAHVQVPLGPSAAFTASVVMSAMLGVPNPITGPGQDRVSDILASMTPMQLFEVMGQLKAMAFRDLPAVRQLLISYPQVTRALFQVRCAAHELSMGLWAGRGGHAPGAAAARCTRAR